MIKHIHDAGRKVAALCGSPKQARKHADAGVDIVIAQGGEGGGHCGEVGSIVLWPQVVKEIAPVPVLAAGASAAATRSPRRWPWARRGPGAALSG
ncbi:nitronate monooxygenase family protein [Mycobacteroides abscessus MAB_082312_2258]|nr:nitronate monooxygenase family protein [Mycobacteroides abscessus MAB_082312_2258]